LINKIITDASKAIASAIDLKALDDSRVQYLGKKGELTDLLKGLGKLSKEERPAMGEAINEAKVKIQKLIETRKEELEELALNQDCSMKKLTSHFLEGILKKGVFIRSRKPSTIFKTFLLRPVLR